MGGWGTVVSAGGLAGVFDGEEGETRDNGFWRVDVGKRRERSAVADWGRKKPYLNGTNGKDEET